MMPHKTRLLFGGIMFLMVLMIGAFSVAAQDTPTPINIGENVTGSITAAAPTLRYFLLVDQQQTLNVRVFAITLGLLPIVTVYDGNNNVIGAAQNNGTQTAVQVAGVQAPAGLVRLEITSVGGFAGDVLVNVQGVQVAPPTPLPTGQIVNGTVSSSAPIMRYSFSGSPDHGRWLLVHSLLPTGGPAIELIDAATNETLTSNSPRLTGLHVAIPAGNSSFIVEIAISGVNGSEAFLICLALENDLNSCPMFGGTTAILATELPPVVAATEAVVPTLSSAQLAPLPQSSVCILGSATGQNVNVRSGPSTTFGVVTTLNGTTTANVIGRLADTSWYQITVGSITGWISASVVRIGGPCQTAPVVSPPPSSGAQPTNTLPPGVTPTSTNTLQPGVIPTSTTGGIQPPAPTATNTVPALTLNYNLPPVHGAAALISGFQPDPFTVGVFAYGPVRANYLGAGCDGMMTSAPSFSVEYTAGVFPVLRFYFTLSGDDPYLVVNAPDGSFRCGDESFGTQNPTIDFNSPMSGRYDVWAGSFEPEFASGTLYVTENTNNHP